MARLSKPPARLCLATLPTPVERAPWLDGGGTEVWIKRDDRSSALYGGGKVRKLEWILANPPFAGDGPIVSVGGIGSHHLLALALYLRQQDRRLHAWTFRTAPTPHILQNLAVMVSLGVEFWPVRTRLALPLAAWSYHVTRRPQTLGRWMGAGASSPLGCFGFVEAGFELADQIRAGEIPTPDRIFVAAGSAGTAAGLALGLALARVPTELCLVSSVEPWAFNRWLLDRKIAAAYALLRAHGLEAPPGAARQLAEASVRIRIDHAQVGAGYGEPTEAAREAVRRAADHGLAIETTYTGKCVAALLDSYASPGGAKRVLFWNTHGAPDLAATIAPDWRERCPFPVPDVCVE